MVWSPKRRTSRRVSRRRGVALAALTVVVVGCSGGGDVDAGDPPDAATETPAAPEQDADREVDETDDPADDATDAPSATATGAAPRADLTIFPGAELVHEQVLAAAVEEVWVVDVPLDEVVEFYASMPGLDGLPGSAITRDDGGGYLELDLFTLVRDGEDDPAVYEAAVAHAEYGPLLRIAVVSSESEILAWFGGSQAQAVIPPGSTVILLSVLTG